MEPMSFSEIQANQGLASLDEVAKAIIEAELGTSATNVAYTGSGNAAFLVSEFEIGNAISLEGGFFLSSGGFPGTSNTSGSFTIGTGQPGDVDLNAVASAAFGGAGSTQDASVLEFDLNVSDPDVDGISFDLVFGSDEFPEFSNTSFVDVAAIFVNGVNVALFNDNPTTPLSVIEPNLVNNNFIDNTGGAFPTEWDGFSRVLTVRANLNFGSNKIKIGIADTGDAAYDSGLYVTNLELLGGGGIGGGVLVVNDGSEGNDDIQAGLSAEEINLVSGQDKVTGTSAALNNDIITNFGDDDVVEVEDATFTEDDVTLTLGSAILDIDTDQDLEPDLKITFEGDFENAEFSFENTGGSTEISIEFSETDVVPPPPPPSNPAPANPNPNANTDTDFNGGGLDDILWRNTDNGRVYVWSMEGGTPSADLLGSAGSEWYVQGTGDFSGSGTDQVLWRTTDSGKVFTWNIESGVTSAELVGMAGSAWQIQGVGDFNAGGVDDIFWRNTDTGGLYIWSMETGTPSASRVGNVGTAWEVEGIGDFDGGGADDILWRNTDTGRVYLWTMEGGAPTAALIGSVGANWQVDGTGDFDGNLTDEILWRNTDNGDVFVWSVVQETPTATRIGRVGDNWSVEDSGDFDGGGADDILWRDADTGRVYTWSMDNGSPTAELIGAVGSSWEIENLGDDALVF